MKLENKIENWKTNKIVSNIGLKKWIRGRVGGVSFTQFFFECLDFFYLCNAHKAYIVFLW